MPNRVLKLFSDTSYENIDNYQIDCDEYIMHSNNNLSDILSTINNDTKNKKRLILVELNEINFDVVKNYIQQNIALPGFKKIIDDGIQVTNAEKEYDNLEPWIQWPSVHFGKIS